MHLLRALFVSFQVIYGVGGVQFAASYLMAAWQLVVNTTAL